MTDQGLRSLLAEINAARPHPPFDRTGGAGSETGTPPHPVQNTSKKFFASQHENFFSHDQFAFLEPIAQNWKAIRDEFLSCDQFMDWPETALYNQGWQAFGLFFKGQRLEDGIARCPKTAELVLAVPGLYIAGFSILQPGTVIYPHVGYTSDVWRSHLGLICPEGPYIEVNGEKKTWHEGEMFVFDDTNLHNAANPSDKARVVLLLDFMK